MNKDLILTAPYQDFNPIDFEDESIVSVQSCEKELTELLTNWQQTLKDTLEDPMVKKNMNLLDPTQAELLKDFEIDTVKIQKDNALSIRNAIMSLHKGLEKIELSLEGMKATFNKPLTPDEAIESFKAHVDNISKGKERDKIRIILK